MRSKDSALLEQIRSYIDEYYLWEEETTSTTDPQYPRHRQWNKECFFRDRMISGAGGKM